MNLKDLNLGFNELGGVANSAKIMKSFKAGHAPYCVYLAPSNLSGYNVCPNSATCREHCLNGSGHNKMQILSHKQQSINNARIARTKLFYENRELFMAILVHEIRMAQLIAKTKNMEFSVRLNGTSDLSPEIFRHPNIEGGKNILEIFPNVQFYDYTKVESRLALAEKYSNYDLTLSYTGLNWGACEKYLTNGGKVAIVFEGELPKYHNGFEVIDANGYDMRYLDPRGTIMGLQYHRVANDYKSGKYVSPNTPFIVKV